MDNNKKVDWLELIKKANEEQYMSNFADPDHVVNTTPDTRLEEFEKHYGVYSPKEILKGVCINYDKDGE